MKNFLPHISSLDVIELNALNFVAKELEYVLISIGVSNTSHSETYRILSVLCQIYNILLTPSPSGAIDPVVGEVIAVFDVYGEECTPLTTGSLR
jgi:hypothetical protein